MYRHDALQELRAPPPAAFPLFGQAVYLADLKRGECAGKTCRRTCRKSQFERIGKVYSGRHGRSGSEADRHPVFAFLHHRRRIQAEQFKVPAKVCCGHKQVDRMVRWQQGIAALAVAHRYQRIIE